MNSKLIKEDSQMKNRVSVTKGPIKFRVNSSSGIKRLGISNSHEVLPCDRHIWYIDFNQGTWNYGDDYEGGSYELFTIYRPRGFPEDTYYLKNRILSVKGGDIITLELHSSGIAVVLTVYDSVGKDEKKYVLGLNYDLRSQMNQFTYYLIVDKLECIELLPVMIEYKIDIKEIRIVDE